MPNDVKAALARIQTDYDFYVACQSDPQTALADYELTDEERAAFGDPDRLEDLLKRAPQMIPPITIKGTHDWVNRAAPEKKDQADELIADEVESVKHAEDDAERREAALRLLRLL
jgi:hypothetical protein